MKVLDLRPGVVRLWQRRVSAHGASEGSHGLARVWSGVVDRVLARRARGRRPTPPGLFVVSVGNLALGGTGKTPVVTALARDLAAQGHVGAVITRGYGSRLRGPLAVEPNQPGTGDEARLMARDLGPLGWVVVQARDRAVGLAWLGRERPDVAVAILEDGHQNPVGRDLDVLILDCWRRSTEGSPRLEPAAGATVPWGPWRESVRGAERADILLVEDGAPPANSASGATVAGFERRLRVESVPSIPWVALSGIARPERFEAEAAELLGREPVLAIRCRDHVHYSRDERTRILAAIRNEGQVEVVTTAKDWIKLERNWPDDLPVAVAMQDLAWTGEKALPDLVGERLGRRSRDRLSG